ncbi:DUF302 domain-containing protein [Vibrio chagasii]|uniref:DUF302 domain-containing protein n=1 Tax=Vibrio chagasii TaxID=170679 RepID=UPI0033711075|nr:conserved hypothetical protein [Vibrio chagasii]
MKMYPFLTLGVAALLVGCAAKPVEEQQYIDSDRLADAVIENIENQTDLSMSTTIDHSRLANAAGEPLSPSRVVMFHDLPLEAELVAMNPLIALDMPMKLLSYQEAKAEEAHLIWNHSDYLQARYNVQFSQQQIERYNQVMSQALDGIDTSKFKSFSRNDMKDDAVIALTSELSFDDTVKQAIKVISGNDDVTVFNQIDYQSVANDQGIALNPTYLIMYGAPAPGGKAMMHAQTMGLDAFPQKLLVWEDDSGEVKVSFNDLALLAERQGVKQTFSLLMIQKRIYWSLEDAFEKSDEQ